MIKLAEGIERQAFVLISTTNSSIERYVGKRGSMYLGGGYVITEKGEHNVMFRPFRLPEFKGMFKGFDTSTVVDYELGSKYLVVETRNSTYVFKREGRI